MDVNGRIQIKISIRVISEIRKLDEQKTRIIPSKTSFAIIIICVGYHVSERVVLYLKHQVDYDKKCNFKHYLMTI